jgi:hypothetical protein
MASAFALHVAYALAGPHREVAAQILRRRASCYQATL